LDGASELSIAGAGMGTLDYAAPEQKRDASKADARSDVYALGLVFYELLTGLRPPVTLKRAPEAWRSLIEKATDSVAADRHANAEELLSEIEAQQQQASTERVTAQLLGTDDDLRCLKCKLLNALEAKVCRGCGTSMRETCLACGASVRSGLRNCDQCFGARAVLLTLSQRVEAASARFAAGELDGCLADLADIRAEFAGARVVAAGPLAVRVVELQSAVERWQKEQRTKFVKEVRVADAARAKAERELAIVGLATSRTDLMHSLGFDLPDDVSWDSDIGWPNVILHRGTGAKLLLVPPGEFMMGSPTIEVGRGSDERQHRRVIRKPFYLGSTQVTQAQWQRLMGRNPSRFQSSMDLVRWLGIGSSIPREVVDQLPVENVSWNECQVFLSRAGGGVRLPSEAEWEYACRAGTTTRFSFGATITPQQANYNGYESYGAGSTGLYRQQTVVVGSMPPNAWGMHEMHGNVWEWCEDGYADYPDSGTEEPAPAASARVLRGGSWFTYADYCRSATRARYDSGYRDGNVGLRLARTLPQGVSALPSSTRRHP
jgi:formylglycine-generating enzyme required for sulfatase activity